MKYKLVGMSSLIILIFTSLLTSNITAQLISVVPQQPYLGKIPVGSKAVRQISIFNLDSKALNISSISLSNIPQFKLLNNPGSATLGPAQSLILNIEFIPTSTGAFSAEMTILSNADTSPNKYSINGFGTWGPKPTFERIIGSVDNDYAGIQQELSDGGYLLGGSTQLPEREYPDFYIIRTDKYGEVLWTHSYGDEVLSESISRLKQNTDGSYIVYGTKQTFKNGPNDLYLAKLNSSRAVIWEKIFGGIEEESPAGFLETSDGGFLLLATSRSFATSTQIYLIKVDQNGNKVWEKNYGGTGGDAGKAIIPTADGNYLILATTSSKGVGNFDVELIKINSNGEVIWDKTYGGTDWDEGTYVIQISDGSFIVSGYSLSYTVSGGHDWMLLKFNSDGDFVWRKMFGGPYQDYANSVREANDGFVIGGTLMLQIQPRSLSDLLVIKTDFDGNEIWRKQFGGLENENGGSIYINSDGNYIISGSSESYSSKSDILFININSSGEITSIKQTKNEFPTDIILYQNYPNPFNNQTKITYKLNKPVNIELSIRNILGQTILVLDNGLKNAGIYNIFFNSDGLASGIYFCVLKANDQILVNKIILLK